MLIKRYMISPSTTNYVLNPATLTTDLFIDIVNDGELIKTCKITLPYLLECYPTISVSGCFPTAKPNTYILVFVITPDTNFLPTTIKVETIKIKKEN